MRHRRLHEQPEERRGLPIFCGAASHEQWWLVEVRLHYPDGRPAVRPVGPSVNTGSGVLVAGGTDGAHPCYDAQRDRWRLRCDRCGDCLTVRAERLAPIVERLTLAGVPAVSLAGLRSVLLT